MVSIIRNARVETARNQAKPVSDYVSPPLVAKGRPYRGRVPYLGKRSFISWRATYQLPNIQIDFRQVSPIKAPIERAFHAVMDLWQVTRVELLSPRRTSNIAKPRQALCALLKEFTTLSLPQIGRKLNRDHTTVMHAVRAVERFRQYDPAFRECYEEARAVMMYGR